MFRSTTGRTKMIVAFPRAVLMTGMFWILLADASRTIIPTARTISFVPSTFSRLHSKSDFRANQPKQPPAVLLFGVQQPFGKQEYWESWYQNRSSASASLSTAAIAVQAKREKKNGSKREGEGDFSWYSSWEDMRPFVHEFRSPTKHNVKSDRILIPGIGMDASLLLDMYHQDGYQQLSAMDYAPASIAYIHDQWSQRSNQRNCVGKNHSSTLSLLDSSTTMDQPVLSPLPYVDLCVADVRQLPYPSESFDVVLDKGTLDSVYLCGDTIKEKKQNLYLAVQELQRVLKPKGGLFWSLSGICSDYLANPQDDTSSSSPSPSTWWPDTNWECQVDTRNGNLFITRNSYTSNNLDGSLIVWRKK
ncbi:hypothetical protein ACA910_000473 [Epithemia clementina (nom. ined.)]